MRRTHSSLMDDLGVDPQVRAEQMGHTVDVNENVSTQASFGRRRRAVNDAVRRFARFTSKWNLSGPILFT